MYVVVMARDLRVAVDATGATDVDDDPRLCILHAEIRRRGLDELKRGRCMDGQDGVPLLIRELIGSARRNQSSSTREQ